MWTHEELAQGFKNAELEDCNGRFNAGRLDETGYVCAELECLGCGGLTSNLQIFLRDFEAYCGEGHCTQLTRDLVVRIRDSAIANAKADGRQVMF